MSGSLLSLLPPVIVLILGYATRNIWLSLLVGIGTGAFIATNGSPSGTLELVASRIWTNLDLTHFFSPTLFWESWNSFICVFLIVLGIFVTLIRHSGGAYAYGKTASQYIRDKKGAETASLMLSLMLFMDDYFSSLTVGSVMHPLTDEKKVPRVKLAFLVDSMAAPLAILCPFSSWVAAIIGFLRENGVSAEAETNTLILSSPLSVYLHMIPYILYSFIMVLSSFYIVRKRISFGLMGEQELIAQKTGNLFGHATPPQKKFRDPHDKNKESSSLIDFMVPISILLGSVILGLLYSGEANIFCGSRSCLEALQHSSAATALFTGGLLALFLTTLFYLIRGKVELKELPQLFLEGAELMLPAIVILLLAWSLGDILRNDLHSGDYLAKNMLGTVPKFLLPLLFFTAASLIAISIGTSWGTAAILFPIAIPMTVALTHQQTPVALETIPLFFPILGAVLSGCVAGDHISPISDTTVMSATSTGADHIDHVRTQMTYAIPVIIATGATFLLLGSLTVFIGETKALLISLPTGVLASFTLLFFLNRIKRVRV
jgi:Na+/H+ antiporter NhaC